MTYQWQNLQPEIVPFKQTPQVELRMHLFRSADTTNPSCGIVFFACGGWKQFDVTVRYPQAQYFASRGAMVGVAEVRVIPDHGTTPQECVTDAKSAIRWMRGQAERFGFPPDRVAAAGGSAAGHVSLCAAMLDRYEEPDEVSDPGTTVSSVPDIVCTYNPAVLPHIDESRPRSEREEVRIKRFGSAEKVWEFSPIRLVRAGIAPVLILQGDEDTITPVENARTFTSLMNEAGNECNLIVYPEVGHGFINYSPEGNPCFEQTLREVDRFLIDHGFLQGEPSV